MPLAQCPNCQRPLSPPLKSTGRQICMKCGWSDKPRQGSATTSPANSEVRSSHPAEVDLSPMDIQKLLKQAAAESLTNMKPKWKREKDANAGKDANAKNSPSDPPLPPLDSL